MPAVSLQEAEAPLVLSIDIGTSSARALAFDRRGRSVTGTECQIPYALTATADGGATLDADTLLDVVAGCVDGALERTVSRAADFAAAGISGFWHSLMGLDQTGRPTTPVLLWADRRSGPDVADLKATIDGAAAHQRTGCVLHSSYWPGKLRWLAREAPETFGRTAIWCGFPELVLRRLTGFPGISVSMASGTGMLDVRRIAWDDEMLAVTGVSIRSMPPVTDQPRKLRLRRPWAERWPALADAVWFPALGDGACANVGTGAVTSGRVALSVGTSGAMRIVLRTSEATGEIPAGYWRYLLDRDHAVDGAAISNGGQVLSWLMNLTRTGFDDADLEAAGELEPDAHGLTLLPFLAGERAPIWNDHATAVIAGLTLATGRPQLLRAGMEAVALRFARVYRSLALEAAEEHQVVATGGAILRSPAWLQITADTLGHDLVALRPEEESSARGAAIVALRDIGAIRDLRDVDDPVAQGSVIAAGPDRHAVYRSALERQLRLERLLFPDGAAWEQGAK